MKKSELRQIIREEIKLLSEGSGGDCYQASANLVINLNKGSNVKLVHGMVNGQGSLKDFRYGHAWVEMNNKILDYSNGRKIVMPIAKYYQIGNIKRSQNKYYNKKEVMIWILKKKHWGPWEMSGDSVVAEEIPKKSAEIGRQKISVPKDILQKLQLNNN